MMQSLQRMHQVKFLPYPTHTSSHTHPPTQTNQCQDRASRRPTSPPSFEDLLLRLPYFHIISFVNKDEKKNTWQYPRHKIKTTTRSTGRSSRSLATPDNKTPPPNKTRNNQQPTTTNHNMASKPGPLYSFPWESMGDYKYLLFVPFVLKAAIDDDEDRWYYHMCCIVALRYVMAQLFLSVSRVHALTRGTRIQDRGVQFAQIDREDHWDDFILLQVYVATAVHHLPWLGYSDFPFLDTTGLKHMLLWHVGPAEFVYYWLHRALHHHYLYSRYHSHHHACKC
jgi:hypothetical protein